MPVQINALFREGEYGGNLDLVAVLNLKLLKRLGHCGLTVVFRDIKPEHAPAFMSLHPIDINVAQRAGRQHSTRKFKRFGQTLLAGKFVDGRAAHHSFNRDLVADWGNQDRISRFQTLHPGMHSMEEQVV